MYYSPYSEIICPCNNINTYNCSYIRPTHHSSIAGKICMHGSRIRSSRLHFLQLVLIALLTYRLVPYISTVFYKQHKKIFIMIDQYSTQFICSFKVESQTKIFYTIQSFVRIRKDYKMCQRNRSVGNKSSFYLYTSVPLK